MANRRNSKLFTKGPPGRAHGEDQAAAEGAELCKEGCAEEFHARLSKMALASWMAATGCDALHCATMSRAQPSQRPHWVATPSSSWMSSNPKPARAWRAISRSETRWQTQTIMAVGTLLAIKRCSNYKYESIAFAITIVIALRATGPGWLGPAFCSRTGPWRFPAHRAANAVHGLRRPPRRWPIRTRRAARPARRWPLGL